MKSQLEPIEGAKEIADRLALSLLKRERSIQSQQESAQIKCAPCQDTGFLMKDGKAHECACVREKRVLARLPERYRNASLLDFPEPVRAAILDWLSKPGDGLVLTGGPGRGKTYLAVAIVRTLLLIKREAYFKRCDKLYASVRDGYRDNIAEASILSEYVKGDYMVLDDLGAGNLSDHERRCTLVVLDDRFESRRSTIVTTNWNLEQISERMDERIASRLASFEQLFLDGPDRRTERA
jgi:chromosomal replication initiation ATPase DnaA